MLELDFRIIPGLHGLVMVQQKSGKRFAVVGRSRRVGYANVESKKRIPHSHSRYGGGALRDLIGNEIISRKSARPAGIDRRKASLGPTSAHALASRQLLAKILLRSGRGIEALGIAQTVAIETAAYPDLGTHHPRTLAS